MGRRNFIIYTATNGCKRWVNLNNVLLFEQTVIKQKKTNTYVNAYLLKMHDGFDEGTFLEVNEMDIENYKKIHVYLSRTEKAPRRLKSPDQEHKHELDSEL